MTEAYKSLVLVSAEKLSAEQVGCLKRVEAHLARAMYCLPRNSLERSAVRDFIDRMTRREISP